MKRETPNLWSRRAGYREVLRVAVPLGLSTSSWSVQHFVDRMFLSWYSTDALAAALPAGILVFTVISFFMGTASYANTFVAQYYGSDRPEKVGPSLWQAIYFTGISALIMPFFLLAAGPLFRFAGHPASVQALEIPYFRILLGGGFLTVYIAAMSCFFSGLGRTWPVMWVNFGITAVNLLADYAVIFGNWGFPEWGIQGAAWATVAANAAGAVAFSVWVFCNREQRKYALRSGWRFDRDLFGRLMRYGIPSGAHFMLDMAAFAVFVLLVGRIGRDELAASNLALQVNTLAFMPLIGFGIANSAIVGQYLGRNKPRLAARATWSVFHLTMSYSTLMALLYIAVPRWFLAPFAHKADPSEFLVVEEMARVILYFVAAYCIFDTLGVIFASALKGAGDTRFVLWWSLGCGWGLMAIPTFVACDLMERGVYTAWMFLSVFVIVLGFGFLARFLGGKWRDMRVIEAGVPAPAIPAGRPEVPGLEADR